MISLRPSMSNSRSFEFGFDPDLDELDESGDLEATNFMVRQRAVAAASYYLAKRQPGVYAFRLSEEGTATMLQLFWRIHDMKPLTPLVIVGRGHRVLWAPTVLAWDEDLNWVLPFTVRVREFVDLLRRALTPRMLGTMWTTMMSQRVTLRLPEVVQDV